MKHIGWFIIIWAMLLGFSLQLKAQHISVSAPTHVAAGENFRVAYTINTRDVEEFRLGGVGEGLEVIAGPYTSSQSSYQMINGHTSSSSSVTITYTLYAAKNGTFGIGASHAIVNGKKLSSHPVKITVSGHAARNNGAPSMHGQNDYDEPRMRTAGSRISGRDLFIKVTANKRRVHEQEPVLLTYKVYTQVDLTQLEGKMPDLKGFHNQEVPLPQQKSFHTETVNGRPYRCVTWSQYVMYPQMTGNLTIPAITFKGIVVQQNRNVDPMEAFFNGGSGYVEVKKDIIAPSVKIQVDPLPQRPANFSGGVGKFNITASIDKKEVKAGEPITIRVVVGGIGNLKLLKQPVITFPKDFDKYDAKVTDKTRLTANGVEGNMIYDFLAVPRNQGNYTIPAVEFTYYDTSANKYKTLHRFECAGSYMQGYFFAVDSMRIKILENRIGKMKSGSWSSHTSLDFRINRLIGGLVALLCLAVEIWRNRQLAYCFENLSERHLVVVPIKINPIVGSSAFGNHFLRFRT